MLEKLQSSTLSSHPLTHSRLKQLSSLAQCTEDHISRVGLGLSIRMGEIGADWSPSLLNEEGSPVQINEKLLKGKTLFKDELALWIALVLQHQSPEDYMSLRRVMIAHWERGVEELASIAAREGDWIRTLRACLPTEVSDERRPTLVDVLGLRCPIPVQKLRMALRDSEGRGEVHLLGDDPESLHDIPALLERLGLPPAEISEQDGGWRFVVRQQ